MPTQKAAPPPPTPQVPFPFLPPPFPQETHTHTHAHAHARTHTHTHTHTHAHARTHAHTHTHRERERGGVHTFLNHDHDHSHDCVKVSLAHTYKMALCVLEPQPQLRGKLVSHAWYKMAFCVLEPQPQLRGKLVSLTYDTKWRSAFWKHNECVVALTIVCVFSSMIWSVTSHTKGVLRSWTATVTTIVCKVIWALCVLEPHDCVVAEAIVYFLPQLSKV